MRHLKETLRTSDQSGSSGKGDRGGSGNTGIGTQHGDPGSGLTVSGLTVSGRRRRDGAACTAGGSSRGCAGSEFPVVVAAHHPGGPRPAAVLA